MIECPAELELSEAECLGIAIVLRMSFTLFCFHLFIFVIICARNSMAAAFHDGCWMFKGLLIVGGFAVQCYFGNDFYMDGTLKVSRWISAIFLIYQALLMLISSYKINEQLVANVEKDSSCCSSAILISFLVLVTSCNVFWIVRQFMVFTCGYNVTIQIITVIGIIIMHGLVLLRSREDASVLTSAIASLYCLYLQWSALSSDSDASCNANLYSDSISWMQIVFGMIFTGLSLFIISGSTKAQKEANLTSDAGAHLMEKEEDVEERPDQEINGKTAHDTHTFAISPATIFFQGLLILSSMYYAMLCTNWGNLVLEGQNKNLGSDLAYWLKLVCEWITMTLYIFSLVAPFLFPDREFN